MTINATAKGRFGSTTAKTSWIIEFLNCFPFIGLFRLRREYTGDWVNDKKSGRGTMFYKNEDRYDGYRNH